MNKYLFLFLGYFIIAVLWKREVNLSSKNKHNYKPPSTPSQIPQQIYYPNVNQKRVDISIDLEDDINQHQNNIYLNQGRENVNQNPQVYQQSLIGNQISTPKIQVDLSKAKNGDYVGNPTQKWREIALNDRHCHHGVPWYIRQELVDPDGYFVARTKSFPAEYTREEVVNCWNSVHGNKPLGRLNG